VVVVGDTGIEPVTSSVSKSSGVDLTWRDVALTCTDACVVVRRSPAKVRAVVTQFVTQRQPKEKAYREGMAGRRGERWPGRPTGHGTPTDPDPPTDLEVIQIGGWSPRYARVLAVATDRDVGVAVVDVNGDRSEVEMDALLWSNGDWGRGSWSGPSSASRGGICAHACGEGDPGEQVQIEFEGRRQTVVTGAAGWWVYVVRLDPRDAGGAFPRRIN
jgi:hypothetical protein